MSKRPTDFAVWSEGWPTATRLLGLRAGDRERDTTHQSKGRRGPHLRPDLRLDRTR